LKTPKALFTIAIRRLSEFQQAAASDVEWSATIREFGLRWKDCKDLAPKAGASGFDDTTKQASLVSCFHGNSKVCAELLGFSRSVNAMDAINSYDELIQVIGEIGRVATTAAASAATSSSVVSDNVGLVRPPRGTTAFPTKSTYSTPNYETMKYFNQKARENGTCFNCAGDHLAVECPKLKKKKKVGAVSEPEDSFAKLPIGALRVGRSGEVLKRKFDTGAEKISIVRSTSLLMDVTECPKLEGFNGIEERGTAMGTHPLYGRSAVFPNAPRELVSDSSVLRHGGRLPSCTTWGR
jgi:hypothetical protein